MQTVKKRQKLPQLDTCASKSGIFDGKLNLEAWRRPWTWSRDPKTAKKSEKCTFGAGYPGCWTAGRMYKWWHKDPKIEQIWKFIDKDKLNAKNGLEKVFELDIFKNIQESWNKDSVENGKLKVCAMKCGAEFDPFTAQFT